MSSPAEQRAGCAAASLQWVAFLATYPIAVLGTAVAAAVWIGIASGGDLAQVGDIEAITTPGLIGATAMVQIGIMGSISLFLALFLPKEPGVVASPPRGLGALSAAIALRAPAATWVIGAFVAVSTLWMLPGWLGARAMESELLQRFGGGDTITLISEAMSRTDDPGWILLAVSVVVLAPVVEELIFRGTLWRAAEAALPGWAVWLLTSFVFAAYHGDPVQVLGVLPIGLFLGWLRWNSGSLWPGIAAHFGNNAIALGITVTVGEDFDPGLGWCIAGFVFSLVASAVAWYVAPRRHGDPRDGPLPADPGP